MSSEQYEKLHELYKELYTKLQEIQERLQSCYGEEKKKLLREFSEKQKEANEMLSEMEYELKSAPPTFRHQAAGQLRAYKRDLVKLQMEANYNALEVSTKERETYSVENEHSTRLESQRALLLQGTESLNRATDSIARSHRIAAETDAIGTDIIEELGEQREKLERTKGRLVGTSENLSKSRKILRSMSRKIVTNKLLLSIIIILELAILGGLIYYKFFSKR
ncbi:vesicle transport through interaction with t-SNAREs homolog 1B [Xenopus tropicalis]|uniref:Vesicle transport through interaction with t-SNAREs homolog 1B n=1 Tax=Xenopus tropicalis TaxID=8364 RepID=Q28GI4_XENTR|nr:vesicle transport through interaction with t-SNAREs homolog 1B [Xenopus tropicalis]CAJ82161.1 vesicle transport through interaction with t-SNAREs homolog 1B (yeast) [Xenopus tropicalis]|eukprot:NP_001016960.1 vesicle transport through interaction with t-SNAREs homolog 1B [Xenopus tropicalis]